MDRKQMTPIVAQSDLHRILLSVEKPGRYTGGEYGIVRKDGADLLRFAVSYPDLYEIGMSNLAVRYLYQQLNALDGVACERVFAPAQDFEAELRAHSVPLCSLETGTPLHEFDLIGFSVGYELTLTNLLNILDLGWIHPRRTDRGQDEPVVIAGGPAVTNPAPFGHFVDAVFIGEFEAAADRLMPELVRLKRGGASRSDMIGHLEQQPHIWTPAKKGAVARPRLPNMPLYPIPILMRRISREIIPDPIGWYIPENKPRKASATIKQKGSSIQNAEANPLRPHPA